MPMIVNTYTDTIIPGFFDAYKPAGFELCFNKTNSPVLTGALPEVKGHGVTIWINSLWPSLCAGHDDEKAMNDPDANWGWLIRQGANVLQTDRPKELLEYLKRKKLHD